MKRTGTHLQGRRGVAFSFFFVIAMLLTLAAAAQSDGKATELPPDSAALIQPEDLVKALQTSGAKPVVLYVGPRFLYAQAHIPGAEFMGPESDPQSLDKLRKRAASLAKNSDVVLYCGCCPWEHCPNIRPAYRELRQMGFKTIKVLYLANSFGTNWAEKGYPVEKGGPR
jgi:thiosulfate/3-mercaptopyruvate sulfurtransferase